MRFFEFALRLKILPMWFTLMKNTSFRGSSIPKIGHSWPVHQFAMAIFQVCENTLSNVEFRFCSTIPKLLFPRGVVQKCEDPISNWWANTYIQTAQKYLTYDIVRCIPNATIVWSARLIYVNATLQVATAERTTAEMKQGKCLKVHVGKRPKPNYGWRPKWNSFLGKWPKSI